MMPAATDAPPVKPPAPPSKYNLSKEDEDDLRAINATIDRMRKVTPQDPYVLTIPQDVEPRYHYHTEYAMNQWRYKAPFDKDEHFSLQYQTFVFHEHGKEIYHLHNSRPPDESLPKGAVANRARAGTGANTPNNSAPKKKITLGDYKKKLTGPNAAATPDKNAVKALDAASKQGAVKGPVERVKAETEEMLAAVAESEAEAAPAPAPAQKEKHAPAQQKELKRKREDEELQSKKKETEKPQEKPVSTASTTVVAEPVAKKLKTTEEKHATSGKTAPPRKEEGAQRPSQKNAQRQAPEETSAPLGMPPRLSPGMPEKLSPPRIGEEPKSSKRPDTQDTTAMPRRLSNTIPPNLLKSLESSGPARSKADLSAPNSASKSKDGKLTPLNKPNGITKKRSPIPKNGFRASSSPAVRSDAEDKPIPKSSARARSPGLSQDEEIAVGKALTANGPSRDRLIVKFKIKKSLRDTVQRMLKMRPQPERSTLPPPPKVYEEARKTAEKPKEQRSAEKTVAAPTKGVATKVGPVKKDKKPSAKEEPKPPVATKRPPPVEDEKPDPPAKRLKAEEHRKEPSTPAPKEVDSPMAQKSTLPATPGTRKDLLSAATMQRQQSQDSVTNYNTPPAQASTPSFGPGSAQTNGVTRPPSSQPSTKTPKQQAWEIEQKRLENLGRELKRAASADLAANANDPITQRTAAIKSLESFLCYLLAFTCADEAALAADPKQAPGWRTWRSLDGFYRFVKATTKSISPLNGLVCSLGMIFNARILEIATQFPAAGPSREVLLELQGTMQKAAADAEAKLDLDVLQETFPTTWSKRTKILPTTEKLEHNKLGGVYKLPLGFTTAPVCAARAGHAMLLEWMEREKIDYYSLKLKL